MSYRAHKDFQEWLSHRHTGARQGKSQRAPCRYICSYFLIIYLLLLHPHPFRQLCGVCPSSLPPPPRLPLIKVWHCCLSYVVRKESSSKEDGEVRLNSPPKCLVGRMNQERLHYLPHSFLSMYANHCLQYGKTACNNGKASAGCEVLFGGEGE